MSSVAPALRSRPAFALTEPVRRAIGVAGIAGLAFFGGMIAIGGAGGPSFEVPAGKEGLPNWIATRTVLVERLLGPERVGGDPTVEEAV